ncbi:peroxidase family protein [Ruegeria sp. HKCCD8929]|uniref:peroxidase family protein n=1 Tax=Ruegeria sp. HKCCD8929 TaxID=2683006 RepID=UPI001487C156|nr:peroxidase family protein [Ruegeria sp. HKCCD8929]
MGYHGLSKHDHLVFECLNHNALNSDEPLPQHFGYLHKANPITGNLTKDEIVNGFDALVETMRTSHVGDGPAAAGMTFLGQFIDHDITLDTTSSIGTRIDPRSIRNVRTPALDLDCVYGDGPEASGYLYSKKHHGFMLFGRKDSPLDLARNFEGTALIGDFRNDENIIVSQIQGAFICLHNILMSHVADDNETAKDVRHCAHMGVRKDVWDHHVAPRLKGFEEVRRFIRLHYQWIILNEFLPAFVDPDVVHAVKKHDPFHDKGPIMPAEFSVAAYRFGHATVQPTYKLKRSETDHKLFDMLGFQARGPESDIEMRMFFDHSGDKAQRALPVGTKMAASLFELPDNIVGAPLDWGGFPIKIDKAKKLGLRNILRDRTALQIPSGQQMADKLGLHRLDTPSVLKDHHIDKTPLWYYCLQEAQEKGGGRLTGVGGSIVASVLIRLLKLDQESVWHVRDFEPWSGFGGRDCTMGSIMQWVEKHRDDIPHRKDLWCH